jgi:hypothetical protein
MKLDTLVCFYSRNGHSRAYARRLAEELDTDIREITEFKRRMEGPLGFIKAGYDSSREKRSNIHLCGLTLLDNYKKIIIVSPVWAGNVPPAIRGFAHDYIIRNAEVFLLINHKGSDESVFLPKFKEVLPMADKVTVIARNKDSEDLVEEKLQRVIDQFKNA